MEKLCIVRRRKRNIDQGCLDERAVLFRNHLDTDNSSSAEDLAEVKEDSVLLSLTPQQGDIVKNNNYLKTLVDKDESAYNLSIDQQQNGNVVFKFSFDDSENFKLIRPKDVCQMLQISNHFLIKLFKDKKIRSFKIGRLRRFALKDVLDFIAKSEDCYKHASYTNFNK